MAKDKANGASEKPLYVCAPTRCTLFEQSHNTFRALVPNDSTKATIESFEFLSALRDRMSAGDVVHVYTEDWRLYWAAIVIGAGRDGGDVRLVVLPGYPVNLPEMGGDSGHDLPSGYSIQFNPAIRQHVPYWGSVPLGDGVPRREEARQKIMHHAKQAASVQ